MCIALGSDVSIHHSQREPEQIGGEMGVYVCVWGEGGRRGCSAEPGWMGIVVTEELPVVEDLEHKEFLCW